MNPRRYSQIERALSVLNKSDIAKFLQDDQHLLFSLKKVERVVAALYVVTSLFSDMEPLKWSIRESGTRLLKDMLSFTERATIHSREFLSDTAAELVHLLSLLDLAHVADALSSMNHALLKKELESIFDLIEGKWRVSIFAVAPPFLQEDFFNIPKEMFKVGEEKKLGSTPRRIKEEASIGEAIHTPADLEYSKKDIKDMSKGQTDSIKDVLDKRTRPLSYKGQIVSDRYAEASNVLYPSKDVKEERKQQILTILEQKKSATIKDFSTLISGCSEKTIQRLLVEMVRDGVLKREGIRRWSRYSIATPRTITQE